MTATNRPFTAKITTQRKPLSQMDGDDHLYVIRILLWVECLNLPHPSVIDQLSTPILYNIIIFIILFYLIKKENKKYRLYFHLKCAILTNSQFNIYGLVLTIFKTHRGTKGNSSIKVQHPFLHKAPCKTTCVNKIVNYVVVVEVNMLNLCGSYYVSIMFVAFVFLRFINFI